jgi:hypothetical protein
VPLFGGLETFAGQGRSRHAGVQHGVARAFQPLHQQADAGGTADAIRSLDDDQLAFQLTGLYGREA